MQQIKHIRLSFCHLVIIAWKEAQRVWLFRVKQVAFSTMSSTSVKCRHPLNYKLFQNELTISKCQCTVLKILASVGVSNFIILFGCEWWGVLNHRYFLNV